MVPKINLGISNLNPPVLEGGIIKLPVSPSRIPPKQTNLGVYSQFNTIIEISKKKFTKK